MEEELSVRRIQAARQHAQNDLRWFLLNARHDNPPGSAIHFREEFRKLNTNPTAIWKVEADAVPFNEAFFRILLATAKNSVPVKSDLKILAGALGRPVLEVRFDSRSVEWPGKYGPAYQVVTDRVRFEAERLLSYLNMTAECGNLHKICDIQSCGHLMTSGRGAKRFCSAECRRAFWSYEQQKDYFIKNQKQRRSAIRAMRQAKRKKGKN